MEENVKDTFEDIFEVEKFVNKHSGVDKVGTDLFMSSVENVLDRHVENFKRYKYFLSEDFEYNRLEIFGALIEIISIAISCLVYFNFTTEDVYNYYKQKLVQFKEYQAMEFLTNLLNKLSNFPGSMGL